MRRGRLRRGLVVEAAEPAAVSGRACRPPGESDEAWPRRDAELRAERLGHDVQHRVLQDEVNRGPKLRRPAKGYSWK